MTDIVERLRYCQKHGLHAAVENGKHCSYGGAADEIARIRDAILRLIDEFAKFADVEDAARDISEALKNSPCKLDHHGYCQAHFLEDDCSIGRLKRSLSDLDGEDDVD